MKNVFKSFESNGSYWSNLNMTKLINDFKTTTKRADKQLQINILYFICNILHQNQTQMKTTVNELPRPNSS